MPDIVTNEQGGNWTACNIRLDLVPPRALLRVGREMAEGLPAHGLDNWRKFTSRELLDRALKHGYKHLAGCADKQHLVNMACRSLMALEQYLVEQGTKP